MSAFVNSRRAVYSWFIFGLVWVLFGQDAWADPARAAEPARAVMAAGAPAADRVSFAVIIGNNKSLGGRRPELHYADDDAARYFEIFQMIAPGRVSLLAEFDRDTQRLFPEAQRHTSAPKLRTLQAVGSDLVKQVRAAALAGHETEVYFIFAGHGDVAQGEGFVELTDARFRSRDLEAWLRAIPFTRAHVILDSCNSFFMLGVRKAGGRHFATSEDAARSLAARLPNVGVFLSTSAEGEAFEWSEIQSGIFSHVVRSGLLGAADANADNSVSYLELAAFVDTATADVANPNMRPHVFARGPGAADHAPIARLGSMIAARRFELRDASALRIRLRDKNGLPLLDAHSERSATLRVSLPQAWAVGAVVERTPRSGHSKSEQALLELYAVPEPPGMVTLASLQELTSRSMGRGPGETFEKLFAQPFGPAAVSGYVARRRSRPPPVYGVSKEDTLRMQLVLNEVARTERGRRLADSLGAAGFGAIIAGAGIGILQVDANASNAEKTEARWIGGGLTGLGGLFVLGGLGALPVTSSGEKAAAEFNAVIRAGGDPAQAFAMADRHLRELTKKRNEERWGAGVVGGITILGCATGLVWSEFQPAKGSQRMNRRLAWSAGMFAGGLMLAEALTAETPGEILAKIWRDDPSLNQYQPRLNRARPAISLTEDGAFFSLSGAL